MKINLYLSSKPTFACNHWFLEAINKHSASHPQIGPVQKSMHNPYDFKICMSEEFNKAQCLHICLFANMNDGCVNIFDADLVQLKVVTYGILLLFTSCWFHIFANKWTYPSAVSYSWLFYICTIKLYGLLQYN